MPAHYPNWKDNTPHTNANAIPSRTRTVSGVTVIEVKNASYRGASNISGFFELVDRLAAPRNYKGKLCIEVYCAWHGVKPPTRYPMIAVGNSFLIHRNYSGEVIDNLS